MATFPSKVNYATGDILTATNMNDVGGAINLLDGAQFAAGKNKIINGDFSVNQRAFTTTTTSGVYMEDRWQSRAVGDGTTTHSVQTFTPGAAPVAGYEGSNYHRIVTTGQTSAAVLSAIVQPLESVRTFAGQTVTASFWAKANTGTPKIGLFLVQNFGSGGSTSVTLTPTAQTIGTTWVRYSYTFAVPSISGKTIGSSDGGLFLFIGVSAGTDNSANFGNIGIQTNTFEIWGVQVEAASTASPFQTATGTKQGELAACQRYYVRFTPNTSGTLFAVGTAESTTLLHFAIPLPVTMRTNPTADLGTLRVYQGATAYSSGTFAIDTAEHPTMAHITYTHGSAVFTAGYAQTLNATSTSTSWVGLVAEL